MVHDAVGGEVGLDYVGEDWNVRGSLGFVWAHACTFFLPSCWIWCWVGLLEWGVMLFLFRLLVCFLEGFGVIWCCTNLFGYCGLLGFLYILVWVAWGGSRLWDVLRILLIFWGVAVGEQSNVVGVYGNRPLGDVLLVCYLVCCIEWAKEASSFRGGWVQCM